MVIQNFNLYQTRLETIYFGITVYKYLIMMIILPKENVLGKNRRQIASSSCISRLSSFIKLKSTALLPSFPFSFMR